MLKLERLESQTCFMIFVPITNSGQLWFLFCRNFITLLIYCVDCFRYQKNTPAKITHNNRNFKILLIYGEDCFQYNVKNTKNKFTCYNDIQSNFGDSNQDGSNTMDFKFLCLSEITELQWLELPMTQTHFDRHFKFKPPKFYCIMVQLFIIFLEYRNKTQCGQQRNQCRIFYINLVIL